MFELQMTACLLLAGLGHFIYVRSLSGVEMMVFGDAMPCYQTPMQLVHW